jgi:multiple sugar transport system ATP-binding protein
MATVSVHNLSKIYRIGKAGERIANKDLNLEIRDREFLVLAGPAGSGKSTLLRLIAGLENPSQGEILIGDKRMNDLLPKDRDVAMVFQTDALYPHLSVFGNLALGLRLRKYSTTEIQKRVADAAAVLGIEDVLERNPKTLSAVQRQRVALGRAIVRQVKVLLLDEPLAQLSADERAQMRMQIGRLHQRLQTTTIYATRDQSEALALADRVVVLNEGIMQQDDAPLKIYGEPANLFVARFFGDPPMNFIQGTLKSDGDKIRFREAEGGTIDLAFAAADRPTAARDYVGKKIILGVRPQNLTATAFSRKENRASAFPAIADTVEPIGAGTDLYFETGAHTLVCRSRETFDLHEAGHRFQLEIDLNAAHLFDPVSTSRIV